MTAAWLQVQVDAAEDFRVQIAAEAFTAPDADWNTILDSLRARIRDLRAPDKANLGLATTRQLIAELHARSEVAATVGEAWPNYRTVDEPRPVPEDALRAIKSEMLRQEYADPSGAPRPSEAETWQNIAQILDEALPAQAQIGQTRPTSENGPA